MDILTIDFETFFDKKAKFNLGKGAMTTEEYVRDHRFQVHGASVRLPNGRCAWLNYRQLYPFFNAVDWSKTAVLAHHAHFDGLILSHSYDVHPCFWFDTLSMARQSLGNHLPKGLDALAKHFGLVGKTLDYNAFDGLTWNQMPASLQQHVGEGSIHDTQLTWDIFAKHLLPTFPRSQLELIDMTVKMFTEPMLEGDIPLLADIEREEAENKIDLLAELNVTATEIGSTARFKELLENVGIEIAFKPGKNGPIPAFAKNDEFMRELQDSEDPYVAALANARIGIKSTTIATRAKRYRETAERGPMPIYLAFAAAHTLRWGGGDAMNWQNLKRRHRIRQCLKAPKGYKIATPDASQVECRFLNTLAGETEIIELFRRGGDPYVSLATAIYGHEVYKPKDGDPRKAEMEMKRGTGKQGELSCGFMSGWKTFKRTAALGAYGPPQKLTDEEAQHAVDTYRWKHPNVCKLWRFAENTVLPMLASGGTMQWGPTWIEHGRIWLPNGAPLIYDTLQLSSDGWIYRTRNGWVNMYGGKLVENWIQAIACCKTGEDMKAIAKLGVFVKGMSHDETWVIVRDDHEAQGKLAACGKIIAASPTWCPEVPLGCETGELGDCYGK